MRKERRKEIHEIRSELKKKKNERLLYRPPLVSLSSPRLFLLFSSSFFLSFLLRKKVRRVSERKKRKRKRNCYSSHSSSCRNSKSEGCMTLRGACKTPKKSLQPCMCINTKRGREREREKVGRRKDGGKKERKS